MSGRMATWETCIFAAFWLCRKTGLRLLLRSRWVRISDRNGNLRNQKLKRFEEKHFQTFFDWLFGLQNRRRGRETGGKVVCKRFLSLIKWEIQQVGNHLNVKSLTSSTLLCCTWEWWRRRRSTSDLSGYYILATGFRLSLFWYRDWEFDNGRWLATYS